MENLCPLCLRVYSTITHYNCHYLDPLWRIFVRYVYVYTAQFPTIIVIILILCGESLSVMSTCIQHNYRYNYHYLDPLWRIFARYVYVSTTQLPTIIIIVLIMCGDSPTT